MFCNDVQTMPQQVVHDNSHQYHLTLGGKLLPRVRMVAVKVKRPRSTATGRSVVESDGLGYGAHRLASKDLGPKIQILE